MEVAHGTGVVAQMMPRCRWRGGRRGRGNNVHSKMHAGTDVTAGMTCYATAWGGTGRGGSMNISRASRCRSKKFFCGWAAAVKMHAVGVGAVLKLSLCEMSILKFALILTIEKTHMGATTATKMDLSRRPRAKPQSL